MAKEWRSVELCKGAESQFFAKFLNENNIYYEPSGAWNMTHFACKMDDDEAQKAAEVLEIIGAVDKARDKAGFREMYALDNGNMTTEKIKGKTYLVFRYPESYSFQDANGAMYDIAENRWVG